MDEKIEALKQFLIGQGDEISDDEINEKYGEYVTPYGDYVVYTEEEADEAAKESVKSIFDDLGLDSFSESYQQKILDNFIEKDWFESALEEDADNLAYEYLSERSSIYANRLVEECYDAGLISDEDFEVDEDGEPDYERCKLEDYDLQDKYKMWYIDSEDAVEWFRSNFGDEDFKNVVKENDLVDIDAVAEDVVNTDGRANSLAAYDGRENEEYVNDTLYLIYRTN